MHISMSSSDKLLTSISPNSQLIKDLFLHNNNQTLIGNL